MDKIIVTAKINPDLDGVSCSLAYAHLLGENAYGGVFGKPLPETEYFIKNHGINIRVLDPSETFGWNKSILVDASQFEGLPKAVSKENVIEVIDHRDGTTPKSDFPNAKVQIELVGAAATLIVEKYIEADKKISMDDAKLLYCAIHHNTLDLQTSNVTERDRNAVKYLESEFGLKHSLIEEMFEYQTKEIIKDPKRVIFGDGKFFIVGETKYAFCQLEYWGEDPKSVQKEFEQNLKEYIVENKCSWGFLSILDLKNHRNIFYAPYDEAKKALKDIFNANFSSNWGEMTPLLLRKQIFPKINELLLGK